MFAALGCFVFFLVTVVTHAEQTAKLQIQPEEKVLTREVGVSVAITCKPNVPDPSLITQLEWRDTRNRKIESINRASPIFVQKLTTEPGAVLIFSKLAENMGGVYTCVANYANTEKIEANVTVNTFVDIEFVDAPENQYPIIGQDYYVRCKVQGNPAPNVEWIKNEETIYSKDRYVIGPDALLIKNVRESDDGVYKCTAVVIETGKIKSRDIRVEVQVPPKIQPMKEISIVEGETATTKCTASGKPPPQYTWIKENTRNDLSITDRFNVKKNTGELLITRVEETDDSLYKCIAENAAGRVEETVKINVLVKPRIFELLNVTANVNTEAKIICKAHGRPPPAITFRKTSTKIPFRLGQQEFDRRITVEEQQFQEKGETFSELIVSNLNRSDDGLYECIAENTAGKAYKNGHITVRFKPTFERTKNISLFWSWDNKPGNLSCLPEAIPNATIIWKYNGIVLENGPNFQIIGKGPQSHLVVRAYNEHRLFSDYYCTASNELGEDTLKLELRRATVPALIPEVRPETITATTIKFHIQPPSHFESLPIRTFVVRYTLENDHNFQYGRNESWSYGAPYILEGLIPERTYKFRFAARNDVGLGAFRDIDIITMPRRSEPAEPKILLSSESIIGENESNRQDQVSVSPYSDHFELRWSIPNDNGDPINMYLIRYCVTEKINGQWKDSRCSEELQQSVQYTSYELNQLEPDTTYKIELRAHNAIGSSSPAQIKIKTARGFDPPQHMDEPAISSATIIGIVIAVVFLVLLIVDITCFCVHRTGIIALVFGKRSKQHDEEDPKLGRDECEPLKPENDYVINGQKNFTAEYDGRQVHTKTGDIIGKNSAV